MIIIISHCSRWYPETWLPSPSSESKPQRTWSTECPKYSGNTWGLGGERADMPCLCLGKRENQEEDLGFTNLWNLGKIGFGLRKGNWLWKPYFCCTQSHFIGYTATLYTPFPVLDSWHWTYGFRFFQDSHQPGNNRESKLLGGWPQPLWKMMEFVTWDDDIPSIWKKQIHVPNHQSASFEILDVITSPSIISHHGTIGGLYHLYPITIG